MIDHPSPNFSKRPPGFDVDILLFHYTGMESCEAALERLCDPESKVSAHYVIDEDGTNQILTRMDDELDGYRKKNPLHAKFPPLASLKNGIKPSEIKDDEGNRTPDEGNFLAVFKRQTTWKSKQGDTNKQTPPRIYDSVGRILTDPIDVPRGSRGLAVYEHGIYNNPGNKGISLRLVGFQIAELAEGNDVKLEAIDGGTFVVEPQEEALI